MTLALKNQITETLFICEKHQERMNYAKSKIGHLFPLQKESYQNLTNDDIAYLDHFMERFSKLQDAMEARLFSQILELTQEQGQFVTFIDKLNKLEKIGAIPEASQWTELRVLRNSFAHDYPSDITMNVETLNYALKKSLDLQSFFASCRKFIEKYM